MKKRLISLLVALCMAVTLLPVSAITAWAEESGSNLKPLRFRQGYPVLDDITLQPIPKITKFIPVMAGAMMLRLKF